jgi:hypothetical protein
MRKKTIRKILVHNESIFKDKVLLEIYLGEKYERYKHDIGTNNCTS